MIGSSCSVLTASEGVEGSEAASRSASLSGQHRGSYAARGPPATASLARSPSRLRVIRMRRRRPHGGGSHEAGSPCALAICWARRHQHHGRQHLNPHGRQRSGGAAVGSDTGATRAHASSRQPGAGGAGRVAKRKPLRMTAMLGLNAERIGAQPPMHSMHGGSRARTGGFHDQE